MKPPRVRPRRQLFLTATELAALAHAAEERTPTAGALVWLLGWSGLRWGEAVALRNRAVDTARRRIEITEAATEIS